MGEFGGDGKGAKDDLVFNDDIDINLTFGDVANLAGVRETWVTLGSEQDKGYVLLLLHLQPKHFKLIKLSKRRKRKQSTAVTVVIMITKKIWI